jgi:hypothetical protein
MTYPDAPYPQYRAPVHRLLSRSELADAEAEMSARVAETTTLIDHFAGRGNEERVRFYKTAMRLLDREAQQFQAEQAELAAASKAA